MRGNALEFVLTKMLQSKSHTIRTLEDRMSRLENMLETSDGEYASLLEWTFRQGYVRCDSCGELGLEENGLFCPECNDFICDDCDSECKLCQESSSSESSSEEID